MARWYFLFVAVFCWWNVSAQKVIKVSSPGGQIVCGLQVDRSGVTYTVNFNKKKLIDPSGLSLQFSGDEFFRNNVVGKVRYRDTLEEYDLLTGKAAHVRAHYKEVIVPLKQREGKINVDLIFRAFDDGLAFRYEMRSGTTADQADDFSITAEHATFKISGNPLVKTLQLPNYTSSHEGHYTTVRYDELQPDTLMDMPMLFQFADAYLAITEAALLDYAGMYLIKHRNVLTSVLSPLPSDTAIKVKGVFPHKSPWRVLLISDKVGGLLTSNILTTLSPPNKLKDASWLKPGTTTFPWWNGNVVPDTLNAPGNNFVTQQYYIDFCARNNIAYHSVVEYGLHQWYVDDGVGFQPGPSADPTTAVPGLDMKEVCDYAHSKGVGVRVWVHWAALYPKIDQAFANYEKWGLSGMMIDFMDRDDQDMVNIQTEMLEKAAKHHLHVQFHGAYKPTGLNRTYPNEFTREGTLNYEVNKWGPALTPEHDLDIAFVRSIAGSTDYHLGGFRAVPSAGYKVQYTRPLMLGTRCHMLAMYVVLENAVSMVCDFPAAYEGKEGFDFIKNVPTAWDESVVPDAELGAYLVMARRKDKNWYIGTINNSTAREVFIPLTFLGAGKYRAEMYTDSEQTVADPNCLAIRNKEVTANAVIAVKLAAGGGVAIRLTRIE